MKTKCLNILKFYQRKVATTFVVVLLFLQHAVIAQSGNLGYFQRAEQLFRDKNYFEASQAYEAYLTSEKRPRPRGQAFAVEKKVKGKTNMNPHEEAVYHLAESYRMSRDYTQAEKWYKAATSFSSTAYPACKYWYAVCLRANGKYAEAIEALSDFEQHYTALDELTTGADREMENLKFIKSQASPELQKRFVLSSQNNGNNITSAYALSLLHGDTVAFTAIHEVSSSGPKATPYYTNDLYYSSEGKEPINHASRLKFPSTGTTENGMACFTNEGRTMFFTRWVKLSGKNISSIFRSDRTTNGWSEPVKLADPINIDGYNSAQPFITPDRRFLLFSSDRPGGYGNYDLWAASLDSNLQVLFIANLGQAVNTAGDEQSPFYHQESRTLVFASNGRTGMGGFDIYYSKTDYNFSHFTQPENPGVPLNSSKDDLYYYGTDPDNLWNEGWISSDRSTNCCLALIAVHGNYKEMIRGAVVDCKTGHPAGFVKIDIIDQRHPDKILVSSTTDSLGQYQFTLDNVSRYRLITDKIGYSTTEKNFLVHFDNGLDSIRNQEICIYSLVNQDSTNVVKETLRSLSRSNTVGNFAYKKSVLPVEAYSNLDSLVNLMKRNPVIMVQVEGYTDAIGSEGYNKRLAQARVDACITYMVKKGIDRRRLKGVSFGKCCPIEPETINGKDNPSGREKNRRVEYKLITGPVNP